ncbi:MAG TPA: glycoside hydrolase family 19 protein [Caulobacteraceae bacterium]
MLTPAQLARLYPRAPLPARAALARAPARASLRTPARVHAFLAQLGHESDGLTRTIESLYYTRPERLMAVWPRRFPTVESATPYLRSSRKLAEAVYGGRLGNTDPGDGARYIGRGYLQITGRANYREMGARIGVDLEAEPERAAEPDIAVEIACAYWTARDINTPADAGDFREVTRRINGGLNGYEDRLAWLARARACICLPRPAE